MIEMPTPAPGFFYTPTRRELVETIIIDAETGDIDELTSVLNHSPHIVNDLDEARGVPVLFVAGQAQQDEIIILLLTQYNASLDQIREIANHNSSNQPILNYILQIKKDFDTQQNKKKNIAFLMGNNHTVNPNDPISASFLKSDLLDENLIKIIFYLANQRSTMPELETSAPSPSTPRRGS